MKNFACVTVLIDDRYKPRRPLKPLDTKRLGSLNRALKSYHIGEMGSRETAQKIIEALFKRDFKPDSKWEVNGAHAEFIGEVIDGQDVQFPFAYQCSKCAIWDHKDIYAEAKSSAKITFISETEIRVTEYGHYVAG